MLFEVICYYYIFSEVYYFRVLMSFGTRTVIVKL